MKRKGILLIFSLFVCCAINQLPKKDEWFGVHYVIMQDWERKLYKELSEKGRQEFKGIFWEERSQEVRDDFLKKIELAKKLFKDENYLQPWNTDRARILLLNGPPVHVEFVESDNWYEPNTSGVFRDQEYEDIQSRMYEIWMYQFGKYMIEYRFKFYPPKEWRLDPSVYRHNYTVEFEKANRDITYGVLDKDYYQKRLMELKKLK
ncbi:MAG: GWxTD domain-containing protein [Candidatus Aminicenantia bacterium]